MTGPQHTKLAALLVQVRVALGQTASQLAKELGVAKRTLGRWETGEDAPDAEVVDRLVAMVGPVDRDLGSALASIRPSPPAPAAVPAGFPAWRLGPDGRVYPKASTPSGTVTPGKLPRPSVHRPSSAVLYLVDSVVCAAADAGTSTPQAVRPILRAALHRASELGLTLAELAQALEATGHPVGKRGD